MEFQDIIFFVIFLVLTLLPKKQRKVLDEGTSQDIETVRKRIEALKRQRSHTQPVSPKIEVEKAKSPKPVFSAYKHIPTNEVVIPSTPVEICTNLPKAKIPPTSFTSKKNITPSTGRNLTTWMIGQIILDKPAFKKNYGNFMDR